MPHPEGPPVLEETPLEFAFLAQNELETVFNLALPHNELSFPRS